MKSATDFERVRRDGRSHAHPLVILVARRRTPDEAAPAPAASPLPTRVGVAAGKGVGTAVRRNRAKRLLRAALQACEAEIGPGWDLVLIARRPLAEVKLAQAQAALAQVLRRAEVLKR